MDFSHLDGTYLGVAGVFLLLLVAQGWLVGRERGWLGVFVPAAYLGIMMFLGFSGRVSSLADFIFAAVGLLGILAWWITAREARRRRFEEHPESSFFPETDESDDVSSSPTEMRHFGELGRG